MTSHVWERRLSVTIAPLLAADFAIVPGSAIVMLSSLHGNIYGQRSVGAIAAEHGAACGGFRSMGRGTCTVRIDGDIAAVWAAIQVARGQTDTALPSTFATLAEPNAAAHADAAQRRRGWVSVEEREREADDIADFDKHGDTGR